MACLAVTRPVAPAGHGSVPPVASATSAEPWCSTGRNRCPAEAWLLTPSPGPALSQPGSPGPSPGSGLCFPSGSGARLGDGGPVGPGQVNDHSHTHERSGLQPGRHASWEPLIVCLPGPVERRPRFPLLENGAWGQDPTSWVSFRAPGATLGPLTVPSPPGRLGEGFGGLSAAPQ